MHSTNSASLRDQIAPKLDSLARCLGRIESKYPLSESVLRDNADTLDVVSLNLERAVQQCVDICMMVLAEQNQRLPDSMAQGFTALADLHVVAPGTAERMRKAVAFRNVAMHEYTRMDLEIVAAICTQHLGDFRAFAREVIAYADGDNA